MDTNSISGADNASLQAQISTTMLKKSHDIVKTQISQLIQSLPPVNHSNGKVDGYA